MSQTKKPPWAFKATPRELQFLVVGVAVGFITALLVPSLAWWVVCYGVMGAFTVLTLVRMG